MKNLSLLSSPSIPSLPPLSLSDSPSLHLSQFFYLNFMEDSCANFKMIIAFLLIIIM